ncbi:MAG: hypothetical protein AAF514_09470 [Verrucomicrobiota bacterium]
MKRLCFAILAAFVLASGGCERKPPASDEPVAKVAIDEASAILGKWLSMEITGHDAESITWEFLEGGQLLTVTQTEGGDASEMDENYRVENGSIFIGKKGREMQGKIWMEGDSMFVQDNSGKEAALVRFKKMEPAGSAE